MAWTIYKYPFEVTGVQTIYMPASARVLTVQTQSGVPCIWAMVNTGNKAVPRYFRILGTGHPADDVITDHYIGTLQMDGGALIWHVFEALGR